MAAGPEELERRGQSPLAYQPRRPVPWRFLDLLAVVAFFLAAQALLLFSLDAVFGWGILHNIVNPEAGLSNTEHAVIRLLPKGDLWVLLLCVLSAVVVTPIAEEFFFRVLLQGWLEAAFRRWRRKTSAWRRLVPIMAGPILLSSLLFAGMHFRRSTASQFDTLSMVILIAVGEAGKLLAVLFAIPLLRWRVGATAVDFGWVPRRLGGDLVLGLATFAVVAVPIYAIQGLTPRLLPTDIAPDPVPLFFFALVLGFLYYRTHRITPLVVVHAALNATSLALTWLGTARV